jgi:hypothetical protein
VLVGDRWEARTWSPADDGRRCSPWRGALVLPVACAAVLAACGSSGISGGASTGTRAGVRFARCMRSHDVPNFPDPGGSFAGVSKQSPAFRSAMQKCVTLEPPATSTGKPFSESQRMAALAQVRCMRDHGMPTFPDPTFPNSGGELFPAIPVSKPIRPRSSAPQQRADSRALWGSRTGAEYCRSRSR